MRVPPALRMAARNLGRNRRRTALTVAAIAFSSFLLVFSVSFQLGAYQMMIDTSLRVFTGILQVQKEGYQERPKMRTDIPDAEALAARLREATGSEAVAVRAQGFALLAASSRTAGAMIVGVQPDREPLVSTLAGRVRSGRFLSPQDAYSIVLGAPLARSLAAVPGDELTLIGSGRDGSSAAAVLSVAGVIETGMPDLDRGLALMPLDAFQELFAMEDRAHAVVLSGADRSQVQALKPLIERALPPGQGLVVLDWETLIPGLKQLIQFDLTQNAVVYALLIIVVTFSIVSTFLMAVLERIREFGVLLALGSTPGGIAAMLLAESAFMALLGVGLGVAAGAAVVAYYAQHTFTFQGMAEIYAQWGLPGYLRPEFSLRTLLSGPAALLLVTLSVAALPARRLKGMSIVEALRGGRR